MPGLFDDHFLIAQGSSIRFQDLQHNLPHPVISDFTIHRPLLRKDCLSYDSTGFSIISSPTRSDTTSAGCSVNSLPGTRPVPVIKKTPCGKSISHVRYSTSSGSARFIISVEVSPEKTV